MRYDLRRPAEGGRSAPRAHTAKLPPVGFGEQHPAYDAYARRTRRVRTAVVVATLAVGGAAVTYFGVMGGLSALLADDTGAPVASSGMGVEVTPGEHHAGALGAGALGGGKAARPAVESPSMIPPSLEVSKSATPGETSRPIRTARPPGATSVPRSPVPTPAPHPTPTCSETPVPSPTASASASASASPDPGPSGEPAPPPMTPE
jgi:hypothetical protein